MLEESSLQSSVTKMNVVHLRFGQVHLKCYIMENTVPLVMQTFKLERVQVTCAAKWTVEHVLELITCYLFLNTASYTVYLDNASKHLCHMINTRAGLEQW